MEMVQDQKSGDNNTKTEYVNVLVMASMRTGSSFVGELFKQNPEFLYIFEPLRALKLHDNDAMLPVLGIEMLRDMYKCNFKTKTTKDFLTNLYNPRVKSGKRDIVRVWVDELERGGATCDYGDGTCFKMSPPRASNSCSGFKYRGIKTIRIQDLNLVVYLMNLADIKLKVINVLRDPRAMMASAIPLHLSKYQKASRSATQYTLTTEHWDDDLDHRLNVYCTSMMRNFLLGTKGTWMPKNQYVPLRYEDMAAAPYDVARKVYDFLGLKLPEIVTKWLEKNTVADLKNDHALYAYTTKRNSTAAAQGWRGRMTFDLAKKIENTGDCGRFMDLLGYRKVIDQGMLQNISVSLLV
ncbi:carbohydrate sulfotransferase 1-like [Ptychodera flava]|uniref:carbohydrate sulfotransferase 1-like n=1 Tax=Ptychodera flava TaxID=63121 RepID=UPI00396A90B7